MCLLFVSHWPGYYSGRIARHICQYPVFLSGVCGQFCASELIMHRQKMSHVRRMKCICIMICFGLLYSGIRSWVSLRLRAKMSSCLEFQAGQQPGLTADEQLSGLTAED